MRNRQSEITMIEESPAAPQSQFAGAGSSADDAEKSRRSLGAMTQPRMSTSPPPSMPRRKGSLGAVIEEATKRASRDPTNGLGIVERGTSPFGDEHEIKDRR
jgi:hypothetical protein